MELDSEKWSLRSGPRDPGENKKGAISLLKECLQKEVAENGGE